MKSAMLDLPASGMVETSTAWSSSNDFKATSSMRRSTLTAGAGALGAALRVLATTGLRKVFDRARDLDLAGDFGRVVALPLVKVLVLPLVKVLVLARTVLARRTGFFAGGFVLAEDFAEDLAGDFVRGLAFAGALACALAGGLDRPVAAALAFTLSLVLGSPFGLALVADLARGAALRAGFLVAAMAVYSLVWVALVGPWASRMAVAEAGSNELHRNIQAGGVKSASALASPRDTRCCWNWRAAGPCNAWKE